jgi:hypothetical protein
LRDAHPAFFNYYLPKGREGEYVTEVHGDLLDMNLKKLEQKGWEFIMMHHTYTPALAKRMSS